MVEEFMLMRELPAQLPALSNHR